MTITKERKAKSLWRRFVVECGYTQEHALSMIARIVNVPYQQTEDFLKDKGLWK